MRIVVGHVYKPHSTEHLSRAQRELFRQNEMKRYESKLIRSSRLYPHATRPDIVHHSEVVTAVGEGGVSDGLKRLSSEFECRVIVLGVKKNPGIMKRLFGQISQSLIFQSDRDILLVPEDFDLQGGVRMITCLSLFEDDEIGIRAKLTKSNMFPAAETNVLSVGNGKDQWRNLASHATDLFAMQLDVNQMDRVDRANLIHWLYDHVNKPLILLR